MKRLNAQTILFIVFILSFCQYGYAQYSIKFTTTDFENLCPDVEYHYAAQIEPNDSNSIHQSIRWEIKGGIISFNFGNSVMAKWDKTGSRSIKASATIQGKTISESKTITFIPFDYNKPTFIKVEKSETYDKYFFFDRNKNNKGTLKITLPEGLADDLERTGTFDMIKQYDPSNPDWCFINIKYTQSQIQGNISVVSLDRCRNASAAEIVPVATRYLDNVEFNTHPSNGIDYGSTSTYTFGVNKKSGVTYNWNVPKDWTIISGQYTNTLQVKPSVNSLSNGTISVNVSAFGDIKKLICAYPGIINLNPVVSGPDFICGNTTYTLSNIVFSDCITTKWKVPSNLRIISQTNTSAVIAPSLSRGSWGEHGDELICARISNGNTNDDTHADKSFYLTPNNLTVNLNTGIRCSEVSKRCILINVTDNLIDPFHVNVHYKWSCPAIPSVSLAIPNLSNVSQVYTSNSVYSNEMINLDAEQQNNTETPEIETRGPSGHFGLPQHPRNAILSYPVTRTTPITLYCTITSGCTQKTGAITINPASFTSFQVGPNPADNNLEIINNSWAEPATLSLSRSTVVPQYTASLYNEFGPVRQINIHPDDRSSSIQTADLPNGMYYLIIKNENQVIDNRIIMVKH